MKKIFLMTFVLLLSGCASTSRTVYYWGDYPASVYHYSIEPTKETGLAYKKSLEDVIEYSKNKNKKVAPGINFELGIVNLKAGNKTVGMKYVEEELQLYPESKKVVQMLIKRMADNK